jgi:glutamyl-tRNA reductase
MAVWALGINHTTAPLDLRGRFAFAMDQIAPHLQGLRQSLQRAARGGHCLHLQPHRNLLRRRATRAGTHPGLAGPIGGVPPSLCAHTYTWKTAGRAPRLSGGQRAGFHGAGRAADSGPAQRRCARSRSAAGALGTTLSQLFQRSLRWPKRCAPPPKLAHTPSAWPPLPCAWRASCLKTWARRQSAVCRRGRND